MGSLISKGYLPLGIDILLLNIYFPGIGPPKNSTLLDIRTPRSGSSVIRGLEGRNSWKEGIPNRLSGVCKGKESYTYVYMYITMVYIRMLVHDNTVRLTNVSKGVYSCRHGSPEER